MKYMSEFEFRYGRKPGLAWALLALLLSATLYSVANAEEFCLFHGMTEDETFYYDWFRKGKPNCDENVFIGDNEVYIYCAGVSYQNIKEFNPYIRAELMSQCDKFRPKRLEMIGLDVDIVFANQNNTQPECDGK